MVNDGAPIRGLRFGVHPFIGGGVAAAITTGSPADEIGQIGGR